AYVLVGPGAPGLPRLSPARTPTPPPLAPQPAPAAIVSPAQEPTENPSQPSDAATPSDQPQPTAAPAPTPREVAIPSGPQLHLPITGLPVLDPGLAADQASVDLIRNLFEGLLVA